MTIQIPIDDENQILDFNTKQILFYIPLTGKDCKCWDCGGNREILIRLDCNGEFDSFDEVCVNPQEDIYV